MSQFEAIAVVGTSCVLPGAFSPQALWSNVIEGRNLLQPATPEMWGLDPETLLRNAADAGEERVVSATGGYVTGFSAVFDPAEFDVDTNGLDPLFLWTLWGAREALHHAGHDTSQAAPRVGLVLGNLGYPSKSMAKWAEAVMLGSRRPDPRNRFHFALPAQLTAKALKLGLGGYSIDAACASSLYAMKLACDRLHDREADLIVAGGINHSDDLFLHAGFTALGALSPSGRSRPFHKEADGLIPAHGAAFVALKRLSDAVIAGDRILGVIRGIGCSNDGRGAGLLTPSREGQVRAMRQAYEFAGIAPAQVSYVECHATGTAVGDSTELRSMSDVFPDAGIGIGSLKSNLGHLITASGAAGFVKLLEAIRHGVMPPTIGCEEPSETLRNSGFRLLHKPEPWKSEGPRLGAISAFGFGGNNAHVIVEEYVGQTSRSARDLQIAPLAIAITGIGVIAGKGRNTPDFLTRLIAGSSASPSPDHAAESVTLSATQLRFPPRDLEHTLPQQVAILQAAQEAVSEAGDLPMATTGVFTGIEVEPGIGRHGVRWRLAEQLRGRGLDPEPSWLLNVRDHIVPPLDGPATILGNMPNMPANRLNSQFDFRGSGFTVGDGELSGEASLHLALRALRNGELDAALVCAVDLSCDSLHTAAAVNGKPPGDAAVALVLCPLDEAVKTGRTIYAVIEDSAGNDRPLKQTVQTLFGHSYAASGLLEIAAAALAVKHRLRFGAEPAAPWLPSQGEWNLQASNFRLSAPEPATPAGYLESAINTRPAKSSQRMEGELAFVFTGAAAAYRHACKDLLLAMPSLTASLSTRFPEMEETAGFVYANSPADLTAYEQLLGSSFINQLHAELTLRVLKLKPQAMIGLSSGETNYMFASGVWSGIVDMMAKVGASGMYDREIAGDFGIARRHWKQDRVDWINVRVLATVERIHEAIAAEPHVRLLIIHAPGDCLIGGDAAATRRVVKKLGVPAFETAGLACHCPEMEQYREGWRALHHRPVTPQPQYRFYSNPFGGPYEPTADRVADALTEQACQTVDFARTVRRAWDDGVRIFVEHGPRNLCAGWITKTLGDRPHLAVSLDQFGKPSVEQITQAIHKLAAAGVEMDADAFFDRLDHARMGWKRPAPGRVLTFPAHRPDFRLEDAPLPAQKMPAPPELPPVLEKPVPVTPAEAAVPALAASNGHHYGNGHGRMPDTTYATLARSAGAAHRNAVQAQVDVLRRTAEARLAVFRDALHRGSLPAAALIQAPPPPPLPVAPPPVAIPPAPAPAAPTPVLQPEVLPPAPTGPTFDRRQLEIHAGGRISEIFGKLFEQQDGFKRQVRMPEPPLLFPDRVTGITGEPGVLQKGSIWTETDIRPDSWYPHERHITPGVLIEAGQADLMLVSWQGIDFINRDQRVYRMLSCELTFKGALPQVGDTLVYDIHIDDHAQLGDVRIFFFHFDCRVNGEVRLQMRNGQAGFFSYAELADPAGVIWDANTAPPDGPPVPFTPKTPVKRTYTREQMTAFANGRAYECFGEGYENLATHTATPRIPSGNMQLLHEVVELDPNGGPWGRGYMKVRNKVTPDDWFFHGHFLNDPCMPGTLMAEAGMQAMSFYLAAMGLTIGRDGWRFEPIPDEVYKLRCRGQVIPTSHTLTYEVFVHRVVDGPQPAVYADILGMVDGHIKAVHGYRLGVHLVPDWPVEKLGLQPRPETLVTPGITVDGFEFGAAGMLASALGRPSDAFGQMYRRFDGPTRTVRLPSPPFLQMTRVTRVSHPPEGMQAGVECDVQYDLENGAWFFRDNGQPFVPLSILMEISLQPCGWLASYAGCVSTEPQDVYLRNLDGSGTMYGPVPDEPGIFTTRTKLVTLSKSGGITLVVFELETSFNGRKVAALKTSFGFFPKQSLQGQVGLAPNREPLPPPSGFSVDLTTNPARYFNGPLKMMSGQLRMLDRITDYWPDGGVTKLGRLRAEKDVDPNEWFFKAHFFQDPVMPGSLGVESIMQLLQFYMLEAGLGEGLANAHFEPIAGGQEVIWKYRGQVVPTARRITVEMEIRDVIRGENDVVVHAESWLMVDGLAIYHMPRVACRIVGSQPAPKSGLSLADIWSHWKKGEVSRSSHPREHLIASLYGNFVGAIHATDPAALQALRGKPVLYLANHQTLMESTLFPFVAPAVTGSPLIVMAKIEQKKSQLVQSMARIFDKFSESPSEPLIYFDQSKPASLLKLTEHLRGAMTKDGRSALIHVEGVRSLTCRKPVAVVSSALIELAMEANVPIVPVRFTGGLPGVPAPAKQDLPYELGHQDYWFGKPITPEELKGMSLVERKARVLAGINGIGPSNEVEEPGSPNPDFAAAVKARMKAGRLNLVEAVLLEGAHMPADAKLDDLLNS